MQQFTWDEHKANVNEQKHGVAFDEAQTVFIDPLGITIPDPLHSLDEERFIEIGLSNKNRLVVVIYTERGNTIRLISARPATKREQKQYE